MKQILYLYREIMPYNIAVLEELSKQGYLVTVLHDTSKKLTPYLPPEIENVTFYSNERFNKKQMVELAITFDPSLIYVSDRTNPNYNYTTVYLRRRNRIPVISGCDSQWSGGKQWINVLTSWFRHKLFFSHMLVAGMRQFEYAKKLGFANNRILWPMNSANVNLFNNGSLSINKFQAPRNFLYVGRFAKAKGLEVLLNAWAQVNEKNGATLTLVGNGPLKAKLKYPSDVIIHDFMSHEELLILASQSSCFVLPSVFEPWGLVIHEFAAAGLPLIVTNACGATPYFGFNNYNGFVVNPGDAIELASSIKRIINMSDSELMEFAVRSRELSQIISPKMVANAITSVLS